MDFYVTTFMNGMIYDFVLYLVALLLRSARYFFGGGGARSRFSAFFQHGLPARLPNERLVAVFRGCKFVMKSDPSRDFGFL